MPTLHANGIDIWYEHLGPADGTPLVLTHGFAGPSSHWRPEILPLADKRPLILYDARGHHRTTVPSDPSDYSMPTFAADLAALLKAIGIERAHIGGVSMGGMITAQFAVDYPEMCAAVLLCDTTCGNAPMLPVSPENPDAAAQWEQRLVTGITSSRKSVRHVGLEATLLREWEWKKANDPHLDISPYSIEDDLERIALMTPEGHIGAASAIASRPDLTYRIPTDHRPDAGHDRRVGRLPALRPPRPRPHPGLPPRHPQALRARLPLAPRDVSLGDRGVSRRRRVRPSGRRRARSLSTRTSPPHNLLSWCSCPSEATFGDCRLAQRPRNPRFPPASGYDGGPTAIVR